MTKPIVVVAGASGLIGSAMVEALLGTHEVHALSRRAGTPRATWHALDLASDAVDLGTLPRRADAVVYLAQSDFFRDFPARSWEVFQVNTASVLKFLDYARGAGSRCFVYGSSGGVYGGGDVRWSEELPIAARGDLGFYLTTKLCSELLAQNYSRFMSVVILRYFFVYGPAQRRSMLIPRLIERIRNGQPIALKGQNGIRLNPTYVSDAAAATARSIGLSGTHIINVGGPEVLSLRDIARLIGCAVGKEPVFEVDSGATPAHLTADISKMEELLIRPQVRLGDGLRAMVGDEPFAHKEGGS